MTGPEPVGSVDLDAIEARADAATPGPWFVASREGDDEGLRIWAEPDEDVDPFEVALMAYDGGYGSDEERTAREEIDAEFIAHAREDVPALLAEVSALRVALATRDAEVERRQKYTDWAVRERSYFYSQMFIERDRADRVERERDAARAETDRQSEGREMEQGMLRAAVSRLVRIADVLGVEGGLDDPESIEARITHIAAERDAARREADEARAKVAEALTAAREHAAVVYRAEGLTPDPHSADALAGVALSADDLVRRIAALSGGPDTEEVR